VVPPRFPRHKIMIAIPTSPHAGVKNRRSVSALTAPLRALSQESDRLFLSPLRPVELDGKATELSRFRFVGPGRGSSYIRLGIFAGIHGDETAGSLAVLKFLEQLHRDPESARGYEIFVYPVCNPTGYQDGTRFNRAGADLNREFWKGTRHPEVRVLEEELSGLKFDGLVSLHSDDTSNGLYGFVRGSSLTRHVLEPALRAAEEVLPRNYDKFIDGFAASTGIIEEGYPGILTAAPEHAGHPFEIVFETPQLADLELQVDAHVRALRAILETYRGFIGYGMNL